MSRAESRAMTFAEDLYGERLRREFDRVLRAGFYIGEPRDSWDQVPRLAAEVDWRYDWRYDGRTLEYRGQ